MGDGTEAETNSVYPKMQETLKAVGYEVEGILEGLCQIPTIKDIYAEHTQALTENQQ